MNKLVLWGHHLDEYCEMFDLRDNELKGRIFEFGSGPSAVNAELEGIAAKRVSADPLFALDESTLRAKTRLIFDDMLENVQSCASRFDFSSYGSLERLVEKRREGMAVFFKDFAKGCEEGRYVGLSELDLPFEDFSFDIALSSHYLFAQLEDQDIQFHLKAIKQLARVAREVRIFPLIDTKGNPSPYLGPVILDLQQNNYGVELRSVAYNLQPAGNAMLRIWAQECPLK